MHTYAQNTNAYAWQSFGREWSSRVAAPIPASASSPHWSAQLEEKNRQREGKRQERRMEKDEQKSNKCNGLDTGLLCSDKTRDKKIKTELRKDDDDEIKMCRLISIPTY